MLSITQFKVNGRLREIWDRGRGSEVVTHSRAPRRLPPAPSRPPGPLRAAFHPRGRGEEDAGRGNEGEIADVLGSTGDSWARAVRPGFLPGALLAFGGMGVLACGSGRVGLLPDWPGGERVGLAPVWWAALVLPLLWALVLGVLAPRVAGLVGDRS